jgi:LysR family hydrogen peroxide-inducible transcriptional activator
MAPYVLPKLIGKFQARYPKVELEILEDTTESLASRLEEGTLDIAIMSTCQQSSTLEAHPLGKEPLFVLLANQHRLAKRKKISWSDLALRGTQLATIAQMVATGMGVSVVPQMMVEHELPSGCVALPFTPPVPMRELNLLRNPLRHETKAAAAFHQEAAAAFSS